MKKTVFGLVLGLLLFVFPGFVLAGRGCCSWHGGQSYCDTNMGRWVCNDGTYSPSCGCTYISPKVVVPTTPKRTIAPTPISTPITSPSASPEVKSASVELTATPYPLPGATAGSVIGGLASGGIILGMGYLTLRWLAKKVAPKEPVDTV